MSDTSTEQTTPRLEVVVIAVIAVVVLGALWYALSQQQQSLRRSPAGLDGLQTWLTSNEISAQNFTGGWPIDQTSIGLLLLPLYDTEFDKKRPQPADNEELLFQQDEYDLESSDVLEKASRVSTLIVLPKWRTGMRLTGRAHPVLNVQKNRLTQNLRTITGDENAKNINTSRAFSEFSYQSTENERLRAQIYTAQLFESDACAPIIGNSDGILLGNCNLYAKEDAIWDNVFILSDPDLLNNHGLRLEDNAKIALDFLQSQAGEENLVIDYSQGVWLRDPYVEPERERTWEDFARFFGPPFLTLWIGAAVIFLLFLWRAALRYGPINGEVSSLGAAKDIAVRARARLLRLSGQDGALAREYMTARLAATASQLFGPAHARHYSNKAAFIEYTERRHPQLADRLKNTLLAINTLPARVPPNEAIRHIDNLEQVLEQISHDA